MIKPSNLGQIIGRLMYGEEAVRRAPRSCYQDRPLKEDGVSGTIRKVLKNLLPGDALNVRQIAALTEPRLTVTQVATNIAYMPDVERVGTKRPYGYRLA